MRIKFAALVLSGLVLAGCATTSDSALFGAAVGATGAAVVGGDVATGAVIGGLAGAACHQAGTC